jgi:hypothetical protein
MKELADRATKIHKVWGDPDLMRDELDLIITGDRELMREL